MFVACVGSLLFLNFPYFGFELGVLIGATVSIARLISIEKTVKKVLDMPEGNAKNYARVQYSIRFLLGGVILLIAATMHPTIHLAGVGVGVITMHIATYITSYLQIKEGREKRA